MASTWQQLSQRASFTNRISTLFDRRRATAHTTDTGRATTTFEVPLFLSPSRYEPSQPRHGHHENHYARSESSDHSLVDGAAPIAGHRHPNSLPSSSRYSSPAPSPRLRPEPSTLPDHQSSQGSSLGSTRSAASSRRQRQRQPTKTRQMHRKKKRTSSIVAQLQALKRLSFAFGITLFATLLTYLVLAATGTASGIMFHVLMVLLILSLTGVFAHSTIRFFLLSKRAMKRMEERRRARQRWHGQSKATNDNDDEEHTPEKPIQIIMAEDEEAAIGHNYHQSHHGDVDDGRNDEEPALAVRHPPPVYGNFRSSKRINPSLVHWQKVPAVPPSPLTPTYDEALSNPVLSRRPTNAAYRPPSYIESDIGVATTTTATSSEDGHSTSSATAATSHIVEQGRRDVDQALKNIHPLERERFLAVGQNSRSNNNFI